MSKCDVSIEFDRASREFVGGEAVSGVVTVRANDDVAAKTISLKSYWETHGRGNRDSGAHHTVTLGRDVQLRSGAQQSFPFEVKAPKGPSTYHGKHLNVDHYVEAEVDLAWARNPKAKQDVLLRAGSEYAGPPGLADVQMHLPRGVKELKGPAARAVGCVIVPIFLGFFLFALFAFWPLAFVLAAIVGFLYVRHRMVKSRVGDVTFTVEPPRVPAGEACTVRLAFKTGKATRVNKIAVTLRAQEVCTSGSGTNRSTRTYEVWSEEQELRGPGALTANEEVRLERAVTVPDKGAYSFEASDNKLRWGIQARIDIPGWPDWARSEPLVVLQPGAAAAEADAGSTPLRVEPPRADAPAPGPSTAATAPAPPPPPSAAPESPLLRAPTDLPSLLATIQATDRYSDERDLLLAESVGRQFSLEVLARSTEWTSGFDDDGYRDGRSIVGTLAGTELPVRARFVKALNASVDALSRGDRVLIHATFTGWDRLLDRAEFDVLSLEGSPPG